MALDRITIEHDFDDPQPRIRDLDVPVPEVLELLARELDTDTVITEHPEIEEPDIKEALLYAAALMRRALSGTRGLPDRESYVASQIALNNPSTKEAYQLFDAEEDDDPLADITAFELEFLKSQMSEPSEPDEGWYFSKEALAKMPLHIKAMHDAIDDVDEQAEDLEEKIENDKIPSAGDQERLAKLVTKAELLESKADELEELYKVMKEALEDYDAFEITWKAI